MSITYSLILTFPYILISLDKIHVNLHNYYMGSISKLGKFTKSNSIKESVENKELHVLHYMDNKAKFLWNALSVHLVSERYILSITRWMNKDKTSSHVNFLSMQVAITQTYSNDYDSLNMEAPRGVLGNLTGVASGFFSYTWPEYRYHILEFGSKDI